MGGPILVGVVFSLVVILLSFIRPNAGRIFLGFFFIAMGIGVNLGFILTQPTFVYDYGVEAWLPLYRTLTESVIGLSPIGFAIFLIIFEVTMGIFLLSKKTLVKIGLIGTMAFVLVLMPITPEQFAWAGPVAANIYLLTKTFDRDVITMIGDRAGRKKSGQPPQE